MEFLNALQCQILEALRSKTSNLQQVHQKESNQSDKRTHFRQDLRDFWRQQGILDTILSKIHQIELKLNYIAEALKTRLEDVVAMPTKRAPIEISEEIKTDAAEIDKTELPCGLAQSQLSV